MTTPKSDPPLGGGGTGEKPHDLVQGAMNYAADGLVFWMPPLGKKRELVGSDNGKWASISVPKTTDNIVPYSEASLAIQMCPFRT